MEETSRMRSHWKYRRGARSGPLSPRMIAALAVTFLFVALVLL